MKPLITVFSTLCLLAVTVIYANSQALTFKRQPNSAKECAICHYEMMEVFIFDNKSTEIAPYPITKEVSSERMCFSCHDGSVGDSRLRVWDVAGMAHKTGTPLKEGMQKLSELPLSDGKITCMTCHTAHGEQNNGTGLTDISNSLFLRMPNDTSQLCKSCHTDKDGKDSHSMKTLNKDLVPGVVSKDGMVGSGGNMACTSCHTVHGAGVKELTIADGGDMSLCRVCHEDLFSDKKTGEEHFTPHVAYKLPLTSDAENAIKAGGGLLGPDGGLVCYSCHKVHSAKGQSILIFPEKGEALCGECHKGFEKVSGGSHDMRRAKGFKTPDGRTAEEAGVCGSCHGGHTWRLGEKSVSSDKITDMCMTCHSKDGPAAGKAINLNMYNHFTGDIDAQFFSKNMKAPGNAAELSKSAGRFLTAFLSDKRALKTVFADKRMTCVTCHDVHSDGRMMVREDAKSGKLCVSCHEEKAGTLSTPHGDSKVDGTCLGCHDIHNSKDKGLVRGGASDDGCLTCHGEQSVKSAEMPRGMVKSMPAELVYKGHNHPTGIGRPEPFPAPMNNKADGKLSCVSCHDPHISDKNGVMGGSFVRTDSRMKSPDDFCALCHDKEKAVAATSHGPDIKKAPLANKRTGRVAGTCDGCHKVHNAYSSEGIPSVDAVYGSPDSLCLNCHSDTGSAKDKKIDVSLGHKTGLLDKEPKDAPLDYFTQENGKYYLRCSTCHDPHLNGPKPGAEGNISDSFLKKLDNQVNICVSCHEDKGRVSTGGHGVANFQRKTADIEARVKTGDICGSCHTMHNSKPKYLMDGDTDSDRCMVCHDKDKMSVKYVGMTHRTDVDIKPELADKLPLIDGRISCKTCHMVHNATPGLIRGKSGRGEDLCGVCHEDKGTVLQSKHNMRINGIKDRDIKKMAAENGCEPCHASHDPDRKTSVAIGKVASGGFAIESHCVSCHTKNGLASDSVPESLRHSSVMKTLKSIEKLAPYIYDASGRKSALGDIDCSTCHDPHKWSADPAKAGQFYKEGLKIQSDNTTSFLKKGVPGEFCIVCHEDPQEWFNNFHSEKYRAEREGAKKPSTLLDRVIKLFD